MCLAQCSQALGIPDLIKRLALQISQRRSPLKTAARANRAVMANEQRAAPEQITWRSRQRPLGLVDISAEEFVFQLIFFETEGVYARTFPHPAKLFHFTLVVAEQDHLKDDTYSAAYFGLQQQELFYPPFYIVEARTGSIFFVGISGSSVEGENDIVGPTLQETPTPCFI
jgi:hypothetical protein